MEEETKQETALAKVIPEKEWLMSLAPAKVEEAHGAIVTVEQSARSDLLPLSQGVKDYSKEAVEKSIMMFLIDLNLYFRDNMRMSNEQIKQTAHLLYQDNYMLNYADINIVLKRFKTGEIKVFGGLDGATICRAFSDYREQKFSKVEEIEQNKDDQLKKSGKLTKRLSKEDVEEAYKQALKAKKKLAELAGKKKQEEEQIKYQGITLAAYLLKKKEERGE